MNYYEHHIGDYSAATMHLSWDEDMAYTRLLRAYYHTEKAIPQGQQYRLARASTPAQRKAVDAVLDEFFVMLDDGWHQKRADAEIGRFKDKQAKAKRSAETRWSALRTHSDGNANASQTHMPTHSEGNAPRARPQTPDTRHQTPEEKESATATAPARARVHRPDGVSEQTWADWLELRKAKKAPVTATVLAGAGREAKKAGMSLEAFLGVWCQRGSQGLQADWLTPQAATTETPRQRAARERMEQLAPGAAAKRPGQTAEIIDVTARRLG